MSDGRSGSEGSNEGATRKVRARIDRARAEVETAKRRVEGAAPNIPALDAGLRTVRLDRNLGGSLLAGAMGFRLFLWMVPAVLVIVGGLGIATTTTDDPSDLARQIGLSAYVVDSISATSTGGSIATLVVGLVALWFGGSGVAKALRTIHQIAWRLPVTPMRRAWRGGLWFTGGCFALAVLAALVERLRDGGPVMWLVFTLLFILLYAGLWLAVSLVLPHRDVEWTGLLPGAVLFGVGAQVLHLVTVVYLIGRIDRASDVYGSLGIAVVLLLWLYLLGRLVVAAPVLNATLAAQRERDGSDVELARDPV